MRNLIVVVLSVFVLSLLNRPWAQERDAHRIIDGKNELFTSLPQNNILNLSAFLGDSVTFTGHFNYKLIKELLKNTSADPKDYVVELKNRALQGFYFHSLARIGSGHLEIIKILENAENADKAPETLTGENATSQEDKIEERVSDSVEMKVFTVTAQEKKTPTRSEPSTHIDRKGQKQAPTGLPTPAAASSRYENEEGKGE